MVVMGPVSCHRSGSGTACRDLVKPPGMEFSKDMAAFPVSEGIRCVKE